MWCLLTALQYLPQSYLIDFAVKQLILGWKKVTRSRTAGASKLS